MSVAVDVELLKRAIEKNGKYEYIGGTDRKRIKVRHKRCGSIVEVTYSTLKNKNKNDVCKACRKGNTVYGDRPAKKELATEGELTAVETFCNRNSKKLFEVLSENGYLFGKELEEYVTYCVVTDDYAMRHFDKEDAINAYLEDIYRKYNYMKIGVCKHCGNIKKGNISWGNGFKKRTCLKCMRKLEEQ